MARYTPPSIDSFGSVDNYLDETAEKHNGNGSKELIKYWNWGKGKHMNIKSLAILFNVSWPTMSDWIDRLHKQHNVARITKEVSNA